MNLLTFAISLNHPNPETRKTIMGIDRKYPLESFFIAKCVISRRLNRKITFEYVMIPNINMGKENARRLVKIARSGKL